MRIEELNDNRKTEYQSFVQANGYFLQYYTWGSFQETAGEKVKRFLVTDEQNNIRLAAQGLTRTVQGKEYIFFPYGPVVSNGLSITDASETFLFFFQELKKQNPHYVFARLEPHTHHNEEDRIEWLKFFQKKFQKTIDLDPHKTSVLDLTKGIEDIQNEMHPKTRYNIRLAEKKGIEIEVLDTYDERVDGAVGLLLATSARAGIRGFEKNYYANLFKYFSTQSEISAKFYLAKHEGDLLAANLMIYFGETAVYLFGGSSEMKRNLMAPYLLHFRAISDAKVRGLKKYDFWGIETDTNHPWHGFSRFKAGFGGKTVDYLGTWDFVMQSSWYNVYKILRRINRIVRK